VIRGGGVGDGRGSAKRRRSLCVVSAPLPTIPDPSCGVVELG